MSSLYIQNGDSFGWKCIIVSVDIDVLRRCCGLGYEPGGAVDSKGFMLHKLELAHL
jgi:hypothetical protein